MFEDILNYPEEDDFEVNTKIICAKCGVTIIEVVINEDPEVDVRDYEFDCRQCSEGKGPSSYCSDWDDCTVKPTWCKLCIVT